MKPSVTSTSAFADHSATGSFIVITQANVAPIRVKSFCALTPILISVTRSTSRIEEVGVGHAAGWLVLRCAIASIAICWKSVVISSAILEGTASRMEVLCAETIPLDSNVAGSPAGLQGKGRSRTPSTTTGAT